MKKKLLVIVVLIITGTYANAQQCLSSGFCSNSTNQYPASTFSTTTSAWTTVSAYMNAGNWTLFNVTSGDVYEWTYCEAYGGVSTNWHAQLTLSNNATAANLCFSDNECGTNGNAPYISWTASFTGVVKLLTSQSPCASNTGAPYNTLVWRQKNGGASTAILGVDVAHFDSDSPYGPITWATVKTTGAKTFAWCKSTEGTTFTDPAYITNMTNGTAGGVVMGAYHFGHPETNTPAAEVSFFLSVAGPYIKACYLPPVLDLEDPSGGPPLTSMTSAALTTWVSDWMSAVKTQTGISPILYTAGSTAAYLNSSLNTYGLWIADPDGSSSAPPASIGVWTTWLFKQYSWTGKVTGIGDTTVDLDVFNGNQTAFNALIGCATGIADQHSNPDFILYPNPASDQLTIENTAENNNQEALISVYTMQGRLVLQQKMVQQITLLNTADFPKGIYLVCVNTSDGMVSRKFVKD